MDRRPRLVFILLLAVWLAPVAAAMGQVPARTWVRAEYLCWWTKGNDLPALVTTSPPGTDRADAGVLGLAGTEVLFGDAKIDHRARSGLRISAGHWLDADREWGLEATYFSAFDDPHTGDFQAATNGPIGAGLGEPILARPFYNAASGQEDAELVSFPAVLDGQVEVHSSSEAHSAGIGLRHLFREGTRGRVDLIGGYRYFRYREGLQIREQLVSTAPGGVIAQGTTFDITDRFVTENDFHGAEFGVATELWYGRWNTEFLAKVALGNLHRRVAISGTETRATPPPNPASITTEGGLLALPTNIGQYSDDDFGALPEFGVNLAYEASDQVRVTFGYTLLLLADVARTGDQIDRSVNPTQLSGGMVVGPQRPAPTDNTSDFWMHGINAGIVFEH